MVQLITLDKGSFVVGAKYRGEFEERLKAVLKEVNISNGQIGIFINEIHKIVGAVGFCKPARGANDITHKAQGLTCFLNCTRITHKAQGVTCVAAKWNDFNLEYSDAVTFSKGLYVIEYLNREQARLQPFDMQLYSSHSSLLSAMKSHALAVMIFNSHEDPNPHEIPAELQVITAKSSEQIQVGKLGGEDHVLDKI
ncbi:ATPase, AAA-type, core [Artemisia annua]|uniref:ATPase, AAA-type, core n=1 Tax=Artemisia annua TaxID=35608 RepID=A0A2U1LSK5_ARTAN|nr:ATPase, AAA-type, core [Artemisia annua]